MDILKEFVSGKHESDLLEVLGTYTGDYPVQALVADLIRRSNADCLQLRGENRANFILTYNVFSGQDPKEMMRYLSSQENEKADDLEMQIIKLVHKQSSFFELMPKDKVKSFLPRKRITNFGNSGYFCGYNSHHFLAPYDMAYEGRVNPNTQATSSIKVFTLKNGQKYRLDVEHATPIVFALMDRGILPAKGLVEEVAKNCVTPKEQEDLIDDYAQRQKKLVHLRNASGFNRYH